MGRARHLRSAWHVGNANDHARSYSPTPRHRARHRDAAQPADQGRAARRARSDFDGFTVFGEVDTHALAAAAGEALARLQAGERDLTMHPNCGTNLAAAGVLSGVAAFVAGSGQRRSLLVGSPAERDPGRDAGAAGRPARWAAGSRSMSPHRARWPVCASPGWNGGRAGQWSHIASRSRRRRAER